MFSESSGHVVRSGTPSTGCPADGRCRRSSDRRGRKRGRPPAGYFTKRLAEDWLRSVLDEARRGTLPGLVKTGATFADAAAEYLRYIEHDRGRKPSTLRGYRSAIKAHLLPAFGSTPIEAVTTEEIERWLAGFGGTARTRNKLLIQLHGILGRQEDVRTSRERRRRGREVPAASRRRHRRVLTRGGLGACTRRGFRTRRCDLLDGCVHRTADGRAARAPLARRRLCGADDQSAGQLLTSLKTSHRRLQHNTHTHKQCCPKMITVANERDPSGRSGGQLEERSQIGGVSPTTTLRTGRHPSGCGRRLTEAQALRRIILRARGTLPEQGRKGDAAFCARV